MSSTVPQRTARSITLRAGAGVALVLLAMGLGACQRTRSISLLPQGLIESETRRLVQAQRMAAEAYQTKDDDDAMRKYTEAVRQYPQLPVAWNNLGVLLMNRDRSMEASSAFATAAELAPSDPRPVYNRALLFDRKGFVREARDFYVQAIQRDPQYLPALRGAIRADVLRNESSIQTLEWIDRALLLEQEPKWLDWLRLQKVRIQSQPDIRALTGA